MLEENGYQYIAVVFGTLYLIPQIVLGHRKKNLQNVSTLSFVVLMFGSMLWAYYLYNEDAVYYAYATGIVTISAITILCQKYIYYVQLQVTSLYLSCNLF